MLTDDGKEIETNKIRTVYRIALDNGIDSLVLGAFGCEVYNLLPEEVAQIFYDVLQEPEFNGKFKEIVFAILEKERGKHGQMNIIGKDGKFKRFYELFQRMIINIKGQELNLTGTRILSISEFKESKELIVRRRYPWWICDENDAGYVDYSHGQICFYSGWGLRCFLVPPAIRPVLIIPGVGKVVKRGKSFLINGKSSISATCIGDDIALANFYVGTRHSFAGSYPLYGVCETLREIYCDSFSEVAELINKEV